MQGWVGKWRGFSCSESSSPAQNLIEIQSTGRFSLVLAPVKSPLLADEMHQNLKATVRNASRLLFAPPFPSSNGRFWSSQRACTSHAQASIRHSRGKKVPYLLDLIWLCIYHRNGTRKLNGLVPNFESTWLAVSCWNLTLIAPTYRKLSRRAK